MLRNDGDGTYGTPSTVTVGGGPTRVGSGDFNRDRRADLVVLNAASRQVAVILGSAGGGIVDISLAIAGKTNRPRTVALRWAGATSSIVFVFRNGTAIARTANDGQFTDVLAARGTYTYKVCQQAPDVCSNPVTVRFQP
jgi:hypothetical protein